MTSAEASLPPPEAELSRSPLWWRRNFIIMAAFFSLSEATVTTPISYATALLGPNVARIGTGAVFLIVVFSSIFLGPLVVKSLGPKRALVVGMLLNTIYAALFAAAIRCDAGSTAQWVVYLTGSLCSGIGSGIIWTAQGTFFACTVDLVRPELRASTGSTDGPLPSHQRRSSSISGSADGPLLTRRRRSSSIPEALGRLTHSTVWTAQGTCFANDEALQPMDCDDGDPAREEATSTLGGLFAAFYLATSVVLETSSSLLQGHFLVWEFGEPVMDIFSMFLLYASISLLTILAVLFVLGDPESASRHRRLSVGRPSLLDVQSVGGKALTAVRIWRFPELWCLAFTNLTFGFSAGFINGYVNGVCTKVSPTFGPQSIGTLMALVSLCAAVCSLLFGCLSTYTGKRFVACIGAIAFGAIPLSTIIVPPTAENDYWGPALLLLYICQGVGRSVYESTNKAIFADFFQGSSSAGAFANCMMQNGFAFFLSFLLQSVLPTTKPIAIIVLTLSALTIPGLFLASALRANRSKKTSR